MRWRRTERGARNASLAREAEVTASVLMGAATGYLVLGLTAGLVMMGVLIGRWAATVDREERDPTRGDLGR